MGLIVNLTSLWAGQNIKVRLSFLWGQNQQTFLTFGQSISMHMTTSTVQIYVQKRQFTTGQFLFKKQSMGVMGWTPLGLQTNR